MICQNFPCQLVYRCWFAKLLSGGKRLKNDGTLVVEPDLKRAENHFRKAIRLNSRYDKAYFKLGILLQKEKKFIESFENLEMAIQINPKFAEAHYHLAVLLMDEEAQGVLSEKKHDNSSTEQLKTRENTKKRIRIVPTKNK